MKAEPLDKLFDENEHDVIQYFDIVNACRPNQKQRRINVDVPEWMISSLNAHAKRLGISRQALIKVWMNDKLTEQHQHP